LTERLGSKQLGESSAILAGDFAANLATAEMLKLRVPQATQSKLLDAFCRLQADAIRGQQLDVVGRAETVDTVYRLKTSSYTVRGPLQLGAILGGASPALLKALNRFAEPVGIAFQLNDDLLSVFGDPQKTGKPFASDIREGKRTELVNVALRQAGTSDRRALERALGNRKSSERSLRQAVRALERTGARAVVEKRIETLRSEAIDALRSRAFQANGRALLTSAAHALSARKA
jgi:geranylgeranyl diphosphate synthase type I